MTERLKGLSANRLRTCLLAALCGAVVSAWAGLGQVHGQTTTAPAAVATPTTQPMAGAIVYTREARPEFAHLKPAPLNPQTAEDLKAIQDRVEAVVKEALPATVGIEMSDGQGSGVIVSKDGYVLTAGHVSGKPGQLIQIIFSNGSRAQAVALGANNTIDSGMIKITTQIVGDYPYVPLGTAERPKLKVGQWVVAMGHPGGYQQSRPPVVRLGRVLLVTDNARAAIATDCTLINGDSGGPVFDLDGRLVGINSRIGASATANLHVPIDTFMETWDRLAKGEEWGGRGGIFASGRGSGRSGPTPPSAGRGAAGNSGPTAVVNAVLGVVAGEDLKQGPVISRIRPGTPAEMAGLKDGDVLTKLNGQAIHTADELSDLIAKHKPGDVVVLDLLRGPQAKKISVTLGADN